MSMKIKVDISDVIKKAPKYEKQTLEKIKIELRKTALVEIETVAKQILTANKHVDTGRLRASIYTSYMGHTAHSYSAKGYSEKYNKKMKETSFNGALSEMPRNEMEVIVGTNVVYATVIHRLTPYLLSAFEGASNKLLNRFKKAI
jgi:hypothetical protein